MKEYYNTAYVIEYDCKIGEEKRRSTTAAYTSYAEALERFEKLSRWNPIMYEVVHSRLRVAVGEPNAKAS